MYIGWLLVLAGETLLFQSPGLFEYFIITFGLFFFFILFYEEPSLADKFGAPYERYRKSVQRWIPHLKPNKPLNPFTPDRV
jgi:protein-S-isoprenylcysteine O-methyltransferase Ste14